MNGIPRPNNTIDGASSLTPFMNENPPSSHTSLPSTSGAKPFIYTQQPERNTFNFVIEWG
jgi:hypothetical protein